MTIDTAYRTLYAGVILILVVLAGLMLVRAIIGPRIADRILSVNMLGTLVIAVIAVSSRYLDEGYLTDVSLIYAMISFVVVMMLATMYIPADPKQPQTPEERKRLKEERRRLAEEERNERRHGKSGKNQAQR